MRFSDRNTTAFISFFLLALLSRHCSLSVHSNFGMVEFLSLFFALPHLKRKGILFWAFSLDGRGSQFFVFGRRAALIENFSKEDFYRSATDCRGSVNDFFPEEVAISMAIDWVFSMYSVSFWPSEGNVRGKKDSCTQRI